MKDTELAARLEDIGMAPDRAREVTRQMRDELRPVAVVAAVKMAQHRQAISASGLAGYDYDIETDGVSGLKKLVKKVGKVVAPIAAIVAAPMTGGASIAAYGAIKSAQIGKKSNKQSIVAQQQMQTQALAAQGLIPQPAEAVAAPAEVAAATGKSKGKGRRGVAVKRQVADTGGQIAAQAIEQNMPAEPAALMQSMLANQGTNMISPAAQSIVREAATEGIQATPAGPSSLPPWAMPAGIGAAALLAVLMLSKKGK